MYPIPEDQTHELAKVESGHQLFICLLARIRRAPIYQLVEPVARQDFVLAVEAAPFGIDDDGCVGGEVVMLDLWD